MKTHTVIFVLLIALAARDCPAQTAAAPSPDSQQMLSATISRLLEDAIPPEYEKQKDWGSTADVQVGWRVHGKPFHWHSEPRERTVNHGVWKHYKLRLIDPAQNLHVTLANLRPVGGGRVAYTLDVDAKIDSWARAKVYEYGVHLIALETEADMTVHVAVEGELACELRASEDGVTMAIVPVVTASRLDIRDFHLRRVSNASGPIVRELGDGIRKLVEEDLNGPKLTEKLNRAIDKKRDRLAFRPAELIETRWWPLLSTPASTATPAPPSP